MPNAVTLMVRSSRKAKWRKHGVYATRDEAWQAITALPDKSAHVRLVEMGATDAEVNRSHDGHGSPGQTCPPSDHRAGHG